MSKQKIDPPELLQIPHQAIVSLNAVINQQLPDGSWHPRAVFHDQFYLRLVGNNERDVKNSLVEQLDKLKERWGGQVGRLATNKDDTQLTSHTATLLSAKTVEPNEDKISKEGDGERE